MTTEIKDGKLVITIDLQEPKASTSGKTLLVATTNGFKKTEAVLNGKEVSVAVNATIKP